MKKVSKTKTDAVLQKLTAHDKRFDAVEKRLAWVTRIEKEVEIHRQEISRIKKELKIQ